MKSENQFAQAVATGSGLDELLTKAADSIRDQIEGTLDLVVAFVAGFTSDEFEQHMPALQSLTGATTVIACSAQAMISGSIEFEDQSGIALWAAHLPNAEIVPMHLEFERAPDGGAIVGWADEMDGAWPDDSTLLALAEPFQFPMDALLERMNEDRPAIPIVGGMASDAQTPGVSRLLLGSEAGSEVYNEGAVVVRLSGGVNVIPVVSQGCRPIGN